MVVDARRRRLLQHHQIQPASVGSLAAIFGGEGLRGASGPGTFFLRACLRLARATASARTARWRSKQRRPPGARPRLGRCIARDNCNSKLSSFQRTRSSLVRVARCGVAGIGQSNDAGFSWTFPRHTPATSTSARRYLAPFDPSPSPPAASLSLRHRLPLPVDRDELMTSPSGTKSDLRTTTTPAPIGSPPYPTPRTAPRESRPLHHQRANPPPRSPSEASSSSSCVRLRFGEVGGPTARVSDERRTNRWRRRGERDAPEWLRPRFAALKPRSKFIVGSSLRFSVLVGRRRTTAPVGAPPKWLTDRS